MKQLTLSEAKVLAEKYFAKLEANHAEWTPNHSREVASLAKSLAIKSKKADPELVEIAGILHDIGYAETKKDGHAIKSLEIIEREGFEVSPTLKDCILNHSGYAEPKTFEGRIIQLSDKASMFNPKIIEMLFGFGKGKILKEDIDWIRKTSEKAAKLIEKFEY